MKAVLAHWLTKQCEFNFILAKELRQGGDHFPTMLSLQQIRMQHPSWVVRKLITLEGACKGEFTHQYLAVRAQRPS